MIRTLETASTSHTTSSSFNMTLLSSGLSGPPCGISVAVFSNIPPLITPALRYLCISDITLPSLMVFDNTSINLLCYYGFLVHLLMQFHPPHLPQLVPSSYWTLTCYAALSLTVA